MSDGAKSEDTSNLTDLDHLRSELGFTGELTEPDIKLELDTFLTNLIERIDDLGPERYHYVNGFYLFILCKFLERKNDTDPSIFPAIYRTISSLDTKSTFARYFSQNVVNWKSISDALKPNGIGFDDTIVVNRYAVITNQYMLQKIIYLLRSYLKAGVIPQDVSNLEIAGTPVTGDDVIRAIISIGTISYEAHNGIIQQAVTALKKEDSVFGQRAKYVRNISYAAIMRELSSKFELEEFILRAKKWSTENEFGRPFKFSELTAETLNELLVLLEETCTTNKGFVNVIKALVESDITRDEVDFFIRKLMDAGNVTSAFIMGFRESSEYTDYIKRFFELIYTNKDNEKSAASLNFRDFYDRFSDICNLLGAQEKSVSMFNEFITEKSKAILEEMKAFNSREFKNFDEVLTFLRYQRHLKLISEKSIQTDSKTSSDESAVLSKEGIMFKQSLIDLTREEAEDALSDLLASIRYDMLPLFKKDFTVIADLQLRENFEKEFARFVFKLLRSTKLGRGKITRNSLLLTARANKRLAAVLARILNVTPINRSNNNESEQKNLEKKKTSATYRLTDDGELESVDEEQKMEPIIKRLSKKKD